MPDSWDDISIKGKPKAEQIIRQSLSAEYYAKFKQLAAMFYICYCKSLYKLSYSNFFSWHLIAEKWPISYLLNMPATDAMIIVHENYAYNCLIQAQNFKARCANWPQEDRARHMLNSRIKQWHCKDL